MIERYAGAVELVCDDCGEAYPEIHESGDRDVLLTDARGGGWRRFMRDGKWRDACPACVTAWARSAGGRQKGLFR